MIAHTYYYTLHKISPAQVGLSHEIKIEMYEEKDFTY